MGKVPIHPGAKLHNKTLRPAISARALKYLVGSIRQLYMSRIQTLSYLLRAVLEQEAVLEASRIGPVGRLVVKRGHRIRWTTSPRLRKAWTKSNQSAQRTVAQYMRVKRGTTRSSLYHQGTPTVNVSFGFWVFDSSLLFSKNCLLAIMIFNLSKLIYDIFKWL